MPKPVLRALSLGLLLLASFALTACTTTKSNSQSRLTHVVIVWLKPDTPADVREAIETGSRKLAAIPGVHNLVVGRALPSDRPIVDDSFDLALSMQFDSVAAMDAYVVHPQHQAFLKVAKPHVAKLLVYDLR